MLLFVFLFLLESCHSFEVRLFPIIMPSPDRNHEEELTRDPSADITYSIALNAFINQLSSDNVQ